MIVTDAIGRRHQCATVQLDFQLPLRFGLAYDGPDGTEHTPVIVHRAVLGSLERMMAILIEHTAGRWPLWLSPRQLLVMPIAEAHADYAARVHDQLARAGFHVETAHAGGKTLNKRVREAWVEAHNYVLVVGDKEEDAGTVNVRARDAPPAESDADGAPAVQGAWGLSDLIDRLKSDTAAFK